VSPEAGEEAVGNAAGVGLVGSVVHEQRLFGDDAAELNAEPDRCDEAVPRAGVASQETADDEQ